MMSLDNSQSLSLSLSFSLFLFLPHSTICSFSTIHVDPVVQSPDKDKDSLVVLGTGATLKRDTLPLHAPSKPPRTGSFRRHHTINRGETESERLDKPPSGGQESVQTHKTDTDVTGKEEAGELAMVNETKELPSKEEERGAGGNGPEVKVSDSSMPGDDGDRRDEITVNSLPVESDSVEVVEKSPSVENSLPVVPHDVAGEAGSQSLEKSSPVVPHGVAGEAGSQSLEKSSPVAPHSVAGEAGSQIVENSLPVAPINGHHEKPAAQLPPDTTKDDKELQNGNGSQVNTKEDKKQDGGGNVKHTEEHPSSEKTVPPRVESSTTDLTTTTSDKATESDSDSKLKDSKSHSDDSAENQSLTRKSSFGVSNGTRLEDSLFDTALLLGKPCGLLQLCNLKKLNFSFSFAFFACCCSSDGSICMYIICTGVHVDMCLYMYMHMYMYMYMYLTLNLMYS